MNHPNGNVEQSTLGQRLRALRLRRGWTLKQMSQRSGIALSTLSKVERDQLTLRYQQLLQVSEKLSLRPADLFADAAQPSSIAGWRSVQRGGDTAYHAAGEYEYGYPCTELRQRQMRPVLIRIRATRETAQRSSVCVAGDEYLYVLAGAVEVQTQIYAPVVLNPGDSMYLDSRMEHSYAAAGCAEATALLVCSEPRPSLLREIQK